MNLRDKSLTEFTELIASTAPAPGGGGASAAVAAVAVALGDMVGELTVGKKKYADVEGEIKALMEKAQALRVRLLELVDEDGENFLPLSRAYAIPKGTPGREEEMERCLRLAVSAPLEIFRLCCSVIDLQDEFAHKGSRLMLSDAACGAAFARGALLGAAANVRVNTRLMSDRQLAGEIDAELDGSLDAYCAKADEIFRFVYDGFAVKSDGSESSPYTAQLLKGGPVAAKITENLKARAEALKACGITPTLAILRLGEKPEDLSYEKWALSRCAMVGIRVKQLVLPSDVTREQLLDEIRAINGDSSIHGCLLLRPLDDREKETEACRLLAPEKDVDGMTPASMAGVFLGQDQGFAPCTAQSCMEILRYYGVNLKGANVVVIGRSTVVGKPVSMLLQKENATVTMCHSETVGLAEICRQADVLVVAAGKAGVVGRDFVRKGQVLVDVGINMDRDGRLCGDVDFAGVEDVVGAITPVPGGVGAVTTSILALHLIEAAEKCRKTAAENLVSLQQ